MSHKAVHKIMTAQCSRHYLRVFSNEHKILHSVMYNMQGYFVCQR